MLALVAGGGQRHPGRPVAAAAGRGDQVIQQPDRAVTGHADRRQRGLPADRQRPRAPVPPAVGGPGDRDLRGGVAGAGLQPADVDVPVGRHGLRGQRVERVEDVVGDRVGDESP